MISAPTSKLERSMPPAATWALTPGDAASETGDPRALASSCVEWPPSIHREPASRRSPADPSSPLAPGSLLDGTPYVIVRLLGRGGMGEVYEVEHAALGRRFAVKLLHQAHRRRPDLAVRLREEARTLAALRHPNLIEVFDLGATRGGLPYFAMELLAGRDLRRELRRLGVLAVHAALGLVAQALDGLEVVHKAGVVHRDIKLENLFLCDDGTLKILDFGIAKLRRAGASTAGATGHGVLGTARSMAPEQHLSGPVDARADIYAAGLLLYELVAGRGPFDEVRGREHAMRYAHCERRPPPPSRFAPQEIPPAVEEAILKAIAKRPEHRFQSAGEMAAALRELRARERVDKAETSSPSRAITPSWSHVALKLPGGIAAAIQPCAAAVRPYVDAVRPYVEAAAALRHRRFHWPLAPAPASTSARIFPFRV